MLKPVILDLECIVCNKSLHRIEEFRVPVEMGKVSGGGRRARTPNWSQDEKQCLVELIKERRDVVVTKANNSVYSEEKDAAWNEILAELSARFGSKFYTISLKKVKTQWQNMKRIAREEIAAFGGASGRYTRQSLEVCHVLEFMKGGVLQVGDDIPKGPEVASIEVKAECVDDEIPEITPEEEMDAEPATRHETGSSNSVTESESYEFDSPAGPSYSQPPPPPNEPVITDDRYNNLTLQKELQKFFKYSATEKQIKMETLKEERQVVRAMRETAELNKIIAEQKLKHVLWMKKNDMTRGGSQDDVEFEDVCGTASRQI